jgi:hypothetical protein
MKRHAMKKLTIIGFLVVIVVVCILLFWQHVKISRFDRDFRQSLAGTWLRQLDNMRCTYDVTPDGSFTCQAIFDHITRTNTYQMTGTWLVKNGNLIETVNRDTNPTARTPRPHAGRIILADARGFTVRWENFTNETVWQRVNQ